MCHSNTLAWACGCVIAHNLERCFDALNEQPCSLERLESTIGAECSAHKTASPESPQKRNMEGGFEEEMRETEVQMRMDLAAHREKALRSGAKGYDYEYTKFIETHANGSARACEHEDSNREVKEKEAIATPKACELEPSNREVRAPASLVQDAQERVERLLQPAKRKADPTTESEEVQPPNRNTNSIESDEEDADEPAERLQRRKRKIYLIVESDYDEDEDEPVEEEPQPLKRKVGRPSKAKAEEAAKRLRKGNKSSSQKMRGWAYVPEDEIKPTQEEIWQGILKNKPL